MEKEPSGGAELGAVPEARPPSPLTGGELPYPEVRRAVAQGRNLRTLGRRGCQMG
jgi:hypothetical protein